MPVGIWGREAVREDARPKRDCVSDRTGEVVGNSCIMSAASSSYRVMTVMLLGLLAVSGL